jgi:gliding motility-associated-like protein
MYKHFKYFILLLTGITIHSLKAQIWYNKGQQFYSGPNSVIQIEGSFMNDSIADSRHNGLIVIDSSFYNLNNSTQQGSGEYDVYKDWINSANFIRDTSFVHLKGATEYIEGNSATLFYNLAIEGSGRKIMRVNASVYNYLYLNSLELATDQDSMFIENPKPSAINSNTTFGGEGFVSTLDSGSLVRKTNSVNTYYYPFGSIIGTPRFRPMNIQPNSTAINYYACSFQNKNPDNVSYNTANKDSDVCKVNNRFYHTISRTVGTTAADITIGYLKTNDGAWNEIGNWRYSINKWTNTKNGTSSTINSYDAIDRKGWSTFSNKPYALINFNPVIDSIEGTKLLCDSTGIYSAINNNANNLTYQWSVTGGDFIGDSTKATVKFKFNTSGSKNIYLTIIDTTTGCLSATFTKNISVSSKPIPGFSVSYLNLFKNTPIILTDSSKGATNWMWDFGNGRTSNIRNPQTAYEDQGTYIIKQVVTNKDGCKDSTDKALDIMCSVKIPNVFSPNGDGKNDVFIIEGMCIKDYTIEIFDRWGLLVYKGTNNSSAWDGRSPSGEICPDGTYYYILKTSVQDQSGSMAGFVTLLK